MLRVRRWTSNLLAVSPPGAVRIDAPGLMGVQSLLTRRVREVPEGTALVMVSRAPWGNRRCRAAARRAGVEVEREYVAFPSVSAPAYLVENSPAALRLFLDDVLAAPPGGLLSAAADAGLGTLRRLRLWRALPALSLGRVFVGSRS